jgi:outer membrane receptor for ferrienterochelin and colicin
MPYPLKATTQTVRLAWALAALTAGAPLAHAESGGPHDAALEEVVVTAQKVTEDVRKVPESISVLSAADIEARHFNEIADLTRSIPNLSFSSQGGPGNQNIELRGVSSGAGPYSRTSSKVRCRCSGNRKARRSRRH